MMMVERMLSRRRPLLYSMIATLGTVNQRRRRPRNVASFVNTSLQLDLLKAMKFEHMHMHSELCSKCNGMIGNRERR